MTKLDKAMVIILVTGILICAAILIFNLGMTIFEDGSFNIGGCPPWAICHIG